MSQVDAEQSPVIVDAESDPSIKQAAEVVNGILSGRTIDEEDLGRHLAILAERLPGETRELVAAGMRHESPVVRFVLVEWLPVLTRSGQDVSEFYQLALQDEDEMVRVRAAAGLAELELNAAEDRLDLCESVLTDENPIVRLRGVGAAKRMLSEAPAEILPLMHIPLDDEEPEIAEAAAEAVVEYAQGDEAFADALPLLERAAGSKAVREYVSGLREESPSRAVDILAQPEELAGLSRILLEDLRAEDPAVLAALKSEDPAVRELVAAKVYEFVFEYECEFPDELFPHVYRLASEESASVRAAAVEWLEQYFERYPEPILIPLKALSKDQDFQPRMQVAYLAVKLIEFGGTEGKEIVEGMLSDERADIRGTLIEQLGHHAPTDVALELIRRLADDKDEEVRREARDAIAGLDPETPARD